MQEVAENLKNWKDAAIKRKLLKKRLEEFLAQHDQESRKVSLLFYDPDLLGSYDVPTFLIRLFLPPVQESLAAKLECCEKTRGNEYSWKRFWSSTCSTTSDELHNDSRNLAILRKERVDNSGCEEPLQSITLPCFSVREQGKKVWTTNKSYFYDRPCRGRWDVFLKHDNSELSLLRDASAKIPWRNGIWKLDREFPCWRLRKS